VKPTAIDALRALRSRGLDDRASENSLHLWSAECPRCMPRSQARRTLTITEPYRDGPVRLSCAAGCDEAEILDALALVAEPPEPTPEVPSGRGPRLRVLDIGRMVASEPPPVPWIVEPLLARGAVTLLVGREGVGKSMLALALAAGIGAGSPVAGIACERGRVLVLDSENGEAETWRRVHALGVAPDALVYVEAEAFDLRAHLSHVEGLLGEHRPDVLVLDSLRSLTPGLEENDSGQTDAALMPLRSLARRYRCAILVLHHANKMGGYRGSTAIGAAVELSFLLEREATDRARRTLRPDKCRIAPGPDPLTFVIEAGDGQITLRGAPSPSRPAADRASGGLAARLGEIVEQRGPLRWGELCAIAGIDPASGTARRAQAEAVAAGVLVRISRGLYGPPERSSVQPPPIGEADGRMDPEGGAR
jgi:KaiC/GvpD/RAD55 family RecA-like ATPase